MVLQNGQEVAVFGEDDGPRVSSRMEDGGVFNVSEAQVPDWGGLNANRRLSQAARAGGNWASIHTLTRRRLGGPGGAGHIEERR